MTINTPTFKSVAGLAAVAGLALLTSAASAQVTVTKYGPSTDTGSTIAFTGPVLQTFTEPNNFFDTTQDTIALFNSGANYSGTEAFGLDVTGSFTVGPAGLTYTFTQNSDDGSYSFLNGTKLISIPGPTASSTGDGPKTLNLLAGTYNYEVRYSESNGAPGTLQFTTPVSTAVPKPSSVASMGLGGLGLLGLMLRARKGKRLSA